jgi:hypothetical protein
MVIHDDALVTQKSEEVVVQRCIIGQYIIVSLLILSHAHLKFICYLFMYSTTAQASASHHQERDFC